MKRAKFIEASFLLLIYFRYIIIYEAFNVMIIEKNDTGLLNNLIKSYTIPFTMPRIFVK